MALTWTYEGSRYKLSGEEVYGTHVVTIIDRNGAANGTFCGTSEGAVLTLDMPSRDVLGPMMGSMSCRVNMVIESQAHVDFIESLTEFQERRFIMQYSFNGELMFTGMIFLDEVVTRFGPDVMREGVLTPSGIFTLVAIDGITTLKNIEYNYGPFGAELPYIDRQEIAGILGQCFDSLPTLGYGQLMVLASNWNPDTGDRDFFSNTMIDNEIFSTQGRQGGYTYRSKYDVISEICKAFDLRCIPVRNNYYFVHLNGISGGHTVFTYDLLGSPSGGSVNTGYFAEVVNCDGIWRMSPDVRSYQPPLQTTKVIYKFDFNGNYLAGKKWNGTSATPICYTELGRVPVPNATTRLRWAGTIQYIPRLLDIMSDQQITLYQIVFKHQIKVGDQYYVRELADPGLGYYQNFRYAATEWTTTPGYFVEVWPHLITLPESYDRAFYAPFFITTLPVPEVLDGELISACFAQEIYDVDNNLIIPATGTGVEYFLDDSDLIVLDRDNNLVEETQIEKVIYNGIAGQNSRGYERTIIFSTGPNQSSENRLTDDSIAAWIDQINWTGDQGTYSHYELLARTLMSRVMNTQVFLEGTIKGGDPFSFTKMIFYDNKRWFPIRLELQTKNGYLSGEWWNINIGDASGLSETEETIEYINRLPNGYGAGLGGGVRPLLTQIEGIYKCIDVDALGIPVPDTTGWTDFQIAARINIQKQSIGTLFYADPPTRVDEWAWNNDTREICLGEQTRQGDRLIITVWVG